MEYCVSPGRSGTQGHDNRSLLEMTAGRRLPAAIEADDDWPLKDTLFDQIVNGRSASKLAFAGPTTKWFGVWVDGMVLTISEWSFE